MKIENPYSYEQECLDYTRWSEGYHSRDEMVDGLVGAIERVLTFRDMQEPTALIPTILRMAIAKAKP